MATEIIYPNLRQFTHDAEDLREKKPSISKLEE